jgi:hypothetical protein
MPAAFLAGTAAAPESASLIPSAIWVDMSGRHCRLGKGDFG